MRYAIALLGLFVVGCATAPSDLENKVSLGMTKEQVGVASVGFQSTRITQGVEYLIYHCRGFHRSAVFYGTRGNSG